MPNDSASVLDRISFWMDSPERPLDFVFIARIPFGLATPGDLIAGFASACATYPRATAVLEGTLWRATDTALGNSPRVEQVNDDASRRTLIERELERTLDPSRAPALRQIIFERSPDGDLEIVTRCHHAAGDLMSVILFVDHQLRAALGAPPLSPGPLRLRGHPRPVRKSRFAHIGPSRSVWVRRRKLGRARRWASLAFDAEGPRAALIRSGVGCTYNDVLGAAALVMLRRFQQEHGADASRLSLWFPVNVREDPYRGFGNGSSRIRIYDPSSGPATLIGRACAFREQVAWCKKHGEWAIPERHPMLRLPAALQRPIFAAYFRRPWVDMGSALFSHAERLGARDELLDGVSSVEVIANLDRRHVVGLAGVTLRGRTRLDLTYDPALLDEEDIDRMLALYREALESAWAELERCAA